MVNPATAFGLVRTGEDGGRVISLKWSDGKNTIELEVPEFLFQFAIAFPGPMHSAETVATKQGQGKVK